MRDEKRGGTQAMVGGSRGDRATRPLTVGARVVRAGIVSGLVLSGRVQRLVNRLLPPGRIVADLDPVLCGPGQAELSGRLLRLRRPAVLPEVVPMAEAGLDGVPEISCRVELLDGRGRVVAGPYAARTDRFGFFRVAACFPALPLPSPTGDALVPGRFTIRARTQAGYLHGTATCTVLPADFAGTVVVSDIDKTYLVSRIAGSRDLFRLLLYPGRIRRTLPGMRNVMAGLRGDGTLLRPLVFLSGTPFFFKRPLQAKFELEALGYEGLYLRPPQPPAVHRLGHREVAAFMRSLSHQYAFKLRVLVRLARQLPAGTNYILLGDDAQTDPLAYATFAALLDGSMRGEDALRLSAAHRALPEETAELAALLAALASSEPGGRVRFLGIRRGGGRGLERLDAGLAAQVTATYESAAELAACLHEAGIFVRRQEP